ncbi:RNA degradosome polyphosphate kinase [Bacillus sp. RG28]|uniref:Polyphosphate kinase n=1 Tax=Gottfriedia endophytica TaxID=2820819 RepID=A0A940NJJ5_9BACI|nr:RNA degradosome polyphosphate kinase [Gottfriedia endophytica]MBP0725322.1 RNA degradosome polyphosphate kinase [Gottfriedia endophytica]
MDHIIDTNKSSYFNNREISWLLFNKRVLEESMDQRNPLLERLKFLSIFSNNLDEFMMVRVAGLKDQRNAGLTKPENKAGMTPKEQLGKISKITHELVFTQYNTYKELINEIVEEGVSFLSIEGMSEEDLFFVEKYFDQVIFPVLTPMAIDAYRPFPMLANKSMNIAVVLFDEKEDVEYQKKLAIVQIPRGLDRFIEIPRLNEKKVYVLLEDVISHYIDKLFIGLCVESITQFRITRNADLEIHEEGAEDLLKKIEKELKMRKWGASVRLEISNKYLDYKILTYLLQELEIHEEDTYFINGPLDLTFLFRFYSKLSTFKEHLIYEKLIPQLGKDITKDATGKEHCIFDIALKKDILLHHPYDSFETVVDLIRCAAEDSNVLAIKQTLYRVSENSPIIEALKKASENGKQVLVLLELKARFDEEHNVHWAKELEKSGCQVIYGKSCLKTHSKITLIVRKVNGEIQRFVHLGTGNYNEETAKFYTDLGLITSKNELGIDATNFFNYLSGFMNKPAFRSISVSPLDIRNKFIELIDMEIKYHKQFGNGRIIAKMNAITEKKLILKFYEASQVGVQIDLIVRGICCLRPGIKYVSENIRVCSIVGRFLEHSRIYYFHQNGNFAMYLSSADLMTRNMENRVEILFPINNTDLKDRILHILNIYLEDNVKARIQDENGCYHYIKKKSGEYDKESQLELYNLGNQVNQDEPY